MKNIQIFENNEFGSIRTQIINDEPYFCLADVCHALDLEQPSRVKSRLKPDGVTTSMVIDSVGRRQNANFVNELNLYKVIFQSRKESAERFTDWVAGEVLPSIRKTGGYQKPATIAEQIGLLATGYGDHEDRIKNLESNMVIDYGQQQTLRHHVNKAVLNALGGKDTEGELAEKVGVGINTIVRYETGKNSPKVEILELITKELGAEIVVIPKRS